ncbi:MAG: hypothetical protein ACI8XM_001715 [Haloarculaceae archaeon]|jgi:hypothetical protein
MGTEPTLDACRREIEELHDFFVAWYTGACDPGDFERMADVIDPGFEMVQPGGDRVDSETVLGMVREARDQYEPEAFDIEIRNVELLDSGTDHALARYEEWQTSPDGETGRISTVLFRTDPAAPNGLVWTALQETWLESG